MISTQSILILKGENSQFEDLLGIIEKQNVSFLMVENVKDATDFLSDKTPTLLLMDLIFDGMDATDYITSLSKMGLRDQVSIVILSGREENYVEIAALNAGADDYMVKPVNKHVFGSRLNAWLRQNAKRNQKSNKGLSNKIELDEEKYVAIVNSESVELQRKEFEIMSLLISKPRKVFSREEIMHSIWAHRESVNMRTIDVHIRNLRSKLGSRRIKTYKGVGYSYDSV